MSCYIDEINAPLYPFGYGLSYTTYAYSPVTLSDSEMPMDGSVTASVTVTNTGSRAGDEIVQLYIHDIYATSTRPVKELKGFRKVHLEPGASAQVDFTLTKEDLSYVFNRGNRPAREEVSSQQGIPSHLQRHMSLEYQQSVRRIYPSRRLRP